MSFVRKPKTSFRSPERRSSRRLHLKNFHFDINHLFLWNSLRLFSHFTSLRFFDIFLIHKCANTVVDVYTISIDFILYKLKKIHFTLSLFYFSVKSSKNIQPKNIRLNKLQKMSRGYQKINSRARLLDHAISWKSARCLKPLFSHLLTLNYWKCSSCKYIHKSKRAAENEKDAETLKNWVKYSNLHDAESQELWNFLIN